MTPAQRLWWRQASSDWELFERLRRDGAPDCHLLHYLQMSTEKLSKAYLWRSGTAPTRSHIGFTKFLRAILDRRETELSRIAEHWGFKFSKDFETWVAQAMPLVYDIQKLAPSQANDGLNPEYPWPHLQPEHCPAEHSFPLWIELSQTGRGRKLLSFIRIAVNMFEQYA